MYDWEENHAVPNPSNHLNLQKTYRCNHLCELHQVRANRSPNTIRRNAFALAYYWEYLLENEKQAEDIYEMDYETQYDYFAQYLKWLKAGKPTVNLEKGPQNKTCNAYLKKVILKIQKEAYGYACLTNDKNYYLENYPQIAVENGRIDALILMTTGGY